MSHYVFKRDPRELAVDAWRPLDRALYRWVRSHGGSEGLAATAAWASLADGHGDTALPLGRDDNRHGMPPRSDADIAQLRDEAMVAADGATGIHPFVLDGAGRFYLWRNFAHEHGAAMRIHARRASRAGVPAAAIDGTRLEADLDLLFHGSRSPEEGPQREAVRGVLGHRLFVLTGGPGTGKTTTVLRMLLMLQRCAERPLGIQIAAPTGKAAQRLVQSLRQGKVDLRQHATAPLPQDWHPLLDTIPDTDALTLHRLLGFQPWRNAFRRNARDPIAADVVVIDEASMVDLAMLHALLDAVRPDATLILVGDADQLTSVATGSVLMDLVSALEPQAAGDLVRLRHSFRAAQYLVRINEAVRAGDPLQLAEAFQGAGDKAVLHAVEDARQLGAQLARWAGQFTSMEDLRPLLPALPASDIESSQPATAAAAPVDVADISAARAALVRTALTTLAQRQLLCALRESPFGALAVNEVLERLLRKAWAVEESTEWYPGRAVMITRNDYAAGLFNGDIGLCLADSDGHLAIWFEASEGIGAGIAASSTVVRSYSPNTLPAHETAFAITIHKSQGSEYQHAAVLLPPDAGNRILSRQLLYTGVSRAKTQIELWGTRAAVETALALEVRRSGGLQDRLG